MRFGNIAVAVAAAFLLAGSPLAAAQPTGLVSVDLTQVAASMAQRLGVDESRMPLSIQVAPEVAAQACGLAAGALARKGAGGAEGCVAVAAASPLLDQVLLARMKRDEDPAPVPAPAATN